MAIRIVEDGREVRKSTYGRNILLVSTSERMQANGSLKIFVLINPNENGRINAEVGQSYRN